VIQLAVLVLLALVVYLAIGDDVRRMLRRRTEGVRVKYTKYLTRGIILQSLVFVVLGVLMRDVFLTLYLFAVAGYLAYLRIKQEMVTQASITPRDVSQLVMAFRGAYQLQPAAFKSLEVAATKVREPLKGIVTSTVTAFFNSSRADVAWDVFRKRTDNVLVHQFIYILEMSETASNESLTAALDAFVERLRKQEELQRQVETTLASVTGQTNFMRVLALGIAFVVAIIPSFRQVYATGVMRLVYVIIMSIVVGASYYIERKVVDLKAQIV